MAEDNDLPEKQPGDFTEMTIGIYGVSSQSGRAYFADYISKGYSVIGYARPSGHGKNIVSEITKEKGLWLRRPQNQNDEMTRFVTLGRNKITNEISKLVELSDIIIIAIPSNYHSEAVEELKVHGLAGKKIPIILSPSRTFAPPYIWKVLGNNFPVVCFSTVPYSCKALAPATVYIKRRKRTWFASLEGKFHADETNLVRKLFPQAVLSTAPAATSLNNIGAVFHPASYLLNLEEIEQAKKENRSYSFYIEGIARKPNIGKYIEKIDQVRLSIAHNLGIETFGLASDPREDAWRAFMQELRMAEGKETDIEKLRSLRKKFLQRIDNCVISAQHWLDITYGVERQPGESLHKTILRTPTYQRNSVPQLRYIDEDIPTGLVPLESLAENFGVNHKEISHIIDLYEKQFKNDVRKIGRNLHEFSREYMRQYLNDNLGG